MACIQYNKQSLMIQDKVASFQDNLRRCLVQPSLFGTAATARGPFECGVKREMASDRNVRWASEPVAWKSEGVGSGVFSLWLLERVGMYPFLFRSRKCRRHGPMTAQGEAT